MSFGFVALNILRILGFVILGILALVLFLLILILFVPIPYSGEVSKYEEFKYKIKVFGITIAGTDKPKRPKKPKEKKEEEPKEKKPFSETIQDVFKKISNIYEELTSPANSYTLNKLMSKILTIFKHIGPRRLDADADFGMEDPSMTGMITGVVSVFPLCYSNHVAIRPNFDCETNYFRGYAKLRGHVQTCFIIGPVLSVLFDRTVLKNLVRILKKINK